VGARRICLAAIYTRQTANNRLRGSATTEAKQDKGKRCKTMTLPDHGDLLRGNPSSRNNLITFEDAHPRTRRIVRRTENDLSSGEKSVSRSPLDEKLELSFALYLADCSAEDII